MKKSTTPGFPNGVNNREPEDAHGRTLLISAPLCIVRKSDGKLAAHVDGVEIAGVGYIAIQGSADGAGVQINLPGSAVYFETESELDRSEIN